MPAPLAHILNPFDVSPCQPTSPSLHPRGPEMTESAASLVSYKRVPKACTQCRRDKSRCDRARPCDGCVRKGRVEACVDGCVTCRQARLSCDGGRPCMSCVQGGRECIEDDPNAIATTSCRKNKLPSPITTSPRRIKPRPGVDSSTPHTRPKCIACQRDNKKCAGGTTCRHCAELGEKCIYVRPLKIIKQRCAHCRKKNKKCDYMRPCVHCVRADVPCIDLPRKGLGRGKRVKRACAGCRADKIQCEEARPCGGCKKKNVECVERGCNACLVKGSSCGPCARQEHFHRVDCEASSNSTSSHSEEGNLSSSSLFPWSPTSPHSHDAVPSDVQHAGRQQGATSFSSSHFDHSKSRYAPAVALSNSLDHPHSLAGLSLDPYDKCPNICMSTGMHRIHPNVSPTPLTSVAELPSFSVGFSPSTLSASTSHVRTRPMSDVSED